MPKVCFFDIDGTLIDRKKKIDYPSPKVVEAINRFQEKGNLIFVATARGILPEELAEINFDGFVCCDGHYIVYNDEVLVDDLFSPTQLQTIIDITKSNYGECIIGGRHMQVYTDLDSPLIIRHEQIYHGGLVLDNYKYDWDVKTVKSNFVTALFYTKEDMTKALNKLPKSWQINAYDTGRIRLDIHLGGNTKGLGCKQIIQKLKIDPQDAYAFGDDLNDIEMMGCVGHGIALGNGHPDLKKVADEVIGNMEDDAIADYLNNIE